MDSFVDVRFSNLASSPKPCRLQQCLRVGASSLCAANPPRRGFSQKPVFFDMIHSNNAARVRLWLVLKRDSGTRPKWDLVRFGSIAAEPGPGPIGTQLNCDSTQ